MISFRFSFLDLIVISGVLVLIAAFWLYSPAELRAFLPSAEYLNLGLKSLFVGSLLFGLTMITAWGEK